MFRNILALARIICVVMVVIIPMGHAAERGKITVGSKIDTEGALLGQMIVLVLENNDFAIEDRTEFGPTPIVRKAIISGEIDIYPEYTGNGAFFFSEEDPSLWKDHKKAYAKVKELDLQENGLVWLTPSPANNTWALAVRGGLAEQEELDSLEDFSKYVSGGGTIKLAACEEFVTREDALPSFEKAYGFKIRNDQMIVFSGCNTAQTEKAAAQGTSGVNTAMAFGTDGALAALGLKLLDDTKGVQPVYAPAPVVRREVLDQYPDIENLLTPVFESLDQETLQELNSRIAIGGEGAKSVAGSYLKKQGLL
ncbi:ABC transporter substrate-binding protein [Desulfopila inferna]|nr:ABC transporter substrate-binding protein [Desulfopila inferna]MBM9603951.1 ABC transporter substrate-binding protein [Desulfopila inferna]